VVPDGMPWQPLRSFLAEDLLVACVFVRYSVWVFGLVGLFWVDDVVPYVVSVWGGLLWDVSALWDEYCFLRIACFEDDWELAVVNPPSLPVYPWLRGCEPGISQDGFVFS
jgi:hypothetical protein